MQLSAENNHISELAQLIYLFGHDLGKDSRMACCSTDMATLKDTVAYLLAGRAASPMARVWGKLLVMAFRWNSGAIYNVT